MNKAVKTVSTVIYVLFFPVFWVWRKGTKCMFNRRKRKAIRKAEKRSRAEGCKVFVIQIERHFITGTRGELRRYNKTGCKVVKKPGNSFLLNFDYRRAIVYSTQ